MLAKSRSSVRPGARLVVGVAGAAVLIAVASCRDARAQVGAGEAGLRGNVASVHTEEIGPVGGAAVSTIDERFDENGNLLERTVVDASGTMVVHSVFDVVAPQNAKEHSAAGRAVRERRFEPAESESSHRLRVDAAGRVVVHDTYDKGGRLLASTRYRYDANARRVLAETADSSHDGVTIETFGFAPDGGLRERIVRSAGRLVREAYVDRLDAEGNWVERAVTVYGPRVVAHKRYRRTIVYARERE